MSDRKPTNTAVKAGPWITGGLLAIVAATFFSDFSHEMCTAILPMYLAAIELGPRKLGTIEAVADFLASASKLLGGYVGHRVEHKRGLVAAGYLVTALATWGIGWTSGLTAIVTLRSIAWIARGFRSPLRDTLLAETVSPQFYGRAYGLERAGDMLGAVAGPLVAALLVWGNVPFQTIILWTLLPGLAAACSVFFFVREAPVMAHGSTVPLTPAPNATAPEKPTSLLSAIGRFPPLFWLFLVGVLLFGLGDFSRTFLIWLVAQALGDSGAPSGSMLSLAVVVYMLHNLVSAIAAYPIGAWGDRRSKWPILAAGYGLGAITNGLFAFQSTSLAWLLPAIALSAIYIAVEETLEKAVAAELLPRELKSLGFGVLASANAVGDMVSTYVVGYFLEMKQPWLAFGLPAACSATGCLWMCWLLWGRSKGSQPTAPPTVPQQLPE